VPLPDSSVVDCNTIAQVSPPTFMVSIKWVSDLKEDRTSPIMVRSPPHGKKFADMRAPTQSRKAAIRGVWLLLKWNLLCLVREGNRMRICQSAFTRTQSRQHERYISTLAGLTINTSGLLNSRFSAEIRRHRRTSSASVQIQTSRTSIFPSISRPATSSSQRIMPIVPSAESLERPLTKLEKAEFDEAISGLWAFLENLHEPSSTSSPPTLAGTLLTLKGQIERLVNDSNERQRGQVYSLGDLIKNLDTDNVPLDSWKPVLLRMTNFANRIKRRYANPTLEKVLKDGQQHLQFSTYALDPKTGESVSNNSIRMKPEAKHQAQNVRSIHSIGWSLSPDHGANAEDASDLWYWLRNTEEMLSDLHIESGKPEVSLSKENQKLHDLSVAARSTHSGALSYSPVSLVANRLSRCRFLSAWRMCKERCRYPILRRLPTALGV
jgi:hypothetical protein